MNAAFSFTAVLAAIVVGCASADQGEDSITRLLRGNEERKLRFPYYANGDAAPNGCFSRAGFEPKWGHPQGQMSQSSCDRLCEEKGYWFSATTNSENPKTCLCANYGRKEADPEASVECYHDTGYQYYHVKEVTPDFRSTPYSGVPVKALEGCWQKDNMPRTPEGDNTIVLPSRYGTTSNDNDCQVQCYNYGFQYSWYQPNRGPDGENYCSCVELQPELPTHGTQTYPCSKGGKIFQVWEENATTSSATSTISTPAPPVAPQITWYNRNTNPATTATWQTWSSEASYCAAQSQRLCSYDDLCPGGTGSEPVGFTANHDRWAAVSRSDACPDNAWVQIGKRNGETTHYCTPYEHFGGGGGCPSWGVNAPAGRAFYHENIACCSVP